MLGCWQRRPIRGPRPQIATPQRLGRLRPWRSEGPPNGSPAMGSSSLSIASLPPSIASSFTASIHPSFPRHPSTLEPSPFSLLLPSLLTTFSPGHRYYDLPSTSLSLSASFVIVCLCRPLRARSVAAIHHALKAHPAQHTFLARLARSLVQKLSNNLRFHSARLPQPLF